MFFKMFANKEYAYRLVDKCYKDEASKFDKHNVSVDSLKHMFDIRYTDETSIYKGKKCIIIGSGGSVLDNERGFEIDKFDIIVRNNLARHEGLEKYVGSRTDIRFMSHKSFGNKLLISEYSSYDENYIPKSKKHHLIIRSAGNVGSMIPGFARNINNNHIFSILDIKYNIFLDRLVNDFDNWIPQKNTCTVGFSAIHTMMDLGCDVYIYGMDFYNKSKAFHYWEDCSTNVMCTEHSIDREKLYIDNLIKEEKIKKF